MSAQVPPEKVREVADRYRNHIVPDAERVRGFSALLLLWDVDSETVTDLTLWEDEDAVRESELPGGPVQKKIEAFVEIVGEEPEIGNHELLIIS